MLARTEEGMSEHQLLRQLRETRGMDWLHEGGADQYSLFQRHFILFHVLYTLQKRHWREHSGHLDISPLCIKRMVYRSGLTGLQQADPLRTYYLDLDNLAATSREDVQRMLDGFWRRYVAGEGRQEALEALGLKEPVERKAIEKRYRELAARHHPDRGGDAEQQARINKAVEILRQYYID